MHASLGLALLKEAKLDILHALSLDQRKRFRTLVIDMIMGTDLANHFEQLSQLSTKTAEGSEGLCCHGSHTVPALAKLHMRVHASHCRVCTMCPLHIRYRSGARRREVRPRPLYGKPRACRRPRLDCQPPRRLL